MVRREFLRQVSSLLLMLLIVQFPQVEIFCLAIIDQIPIGQISNLEEIKTLEIQNGVRLERVLLSRVMTQM
jgi:hypothetical protein